MIGLFMEPRGVNPGSHERIRLRLKAVLCLSVGATSRHGIAILCAFTQGQALGILQARIKAWMQVYRATGGVKAGRRSFSFVASGQAKEGSKKRQFAKNSVIALKGSRIHNSWVLAREGIPFVSVCALLSVAAGALSIWTLFLPLVLITGFVAFFFRDPNRRIEAPPNAVLTPADGRVIEIDEQPPFENRLKGASMKVSIFMSLFSVHVNRIPVSGNVMRITYHPGRFFSAHLDKASKHNERNCITLETSDSHRVLVVQVAGLIARRIACWVAEGDQVRAGQRFGLIRFGSRVEVYLPAGSSICVDLRQRVRAGETILAYLP